MKPTIRQILQGRYQATNRQGQTQNFDDLTEAQAYANTGTMIEYKGFEIHPVTFEIWKDGRQVPGSYWRHNVSVEAAKITIDASLIAKELKASHALVLQEIEDDRFSRWMENENEKQMYDHER